MNTIIGNTVGTPVPPAANALKGSASGNPIRLDDVSPLQHEIAVSVTKKETIYTKGEEIADSEWSEDISDSIRELEEDTFLTITEIEGDDKLYFDNGGYWEGSGQFTTGDNEGHVLADSFSVGEVVCISPYEFGDGEMHLWLCKATATESSGPANGATIEKRGVENLFSLADFSYQGSASKVSVEDNKATSHFWHGGQIKNIVNATCMSDYYNGVKPIPAGTYTFLCNPFKNSKGDIYNPGLDIKLEDGTGGRIEANVPTEVFQSFSPSAISFFNSVPMTETETYSTSLQLVKAGVYVADENGKVKGILGNGETVTLIAESGVTISAEYNRDINKAFAEIQQAIATMGAAAATIPEEV